MKLAAHQPYFFPYIGYFSLISAVDVFVYYDVTQFERQNWMTRNRILKPTDFNDFQYIKIDLEKPPFKAMLPGCRLKTDQKWKERLIAQLQHYKRKAPFFCETMQLLNEILVRDDNLLMDFNIRSTTLIARLLNIKTSIYQFSKLKRPVETTAGGGYCGISICKALEADTYINAPGGEQFYPKDAYKEAGIKLGFIQHNLSPYSQKNNHFIEALSIIDVLMFNGIAATREMINDYSIKWMQN